MALWGGRFNSEIDNAMFALSQSTAIDWRLAPYDIAGSLAHLGALERNALIDSKLAGEIRTALLDMMNELRNATLKPDVKDEDVHSALERILIERVGPQAGAIRAGRSRNDQVATDF